MKEGNKKYFDNTITIAITVYERYDYFEEAINSAISQTVNCNIIIVDNDSKHTKFKDYVQNLNDPNIKYYKNDHNVGMVENWNQCIRLCNTEWLTILHDDDALHPRFIEYFINVLKNKPKMKGFVCSMYYVGAKVKFEDVNFDSKLRKLSKKEFLFGNISPFPGIVFRKNNNTLFDEKMYPSADYDFWCRLVIQGDFYMSKMKLAFYRINKDQTSFIVVDDIINKTKLYRKKNIISFWNPIELLISNYSLNELYRFYHNSYSNEQLPNKSNLIMKVLCILYRKLI